jgi:hypothetical protein
LDIANEHPPKPKSATPIEMAGKQEDTDDVNETKSAIWNPACLLLSTPLLPGDQDYRNSAQKRIDSVEKFIS